MAKQDEIRIRMSKESKLKARIQAAAGAAGESLNVFIIRAIDARLQAQGKDHTGNQGRK